jgi:hypothetical protein
VSRMVVAVVGGRVGTRWDQFRRTTAVVLSRYVAVVTGLLIKDTLASTASRLDERASNDKNNEKNASE